MHLQSDWYGLHGLLLGRIPAWRS